jgi:hypothetical protein
LSSGCSSQRLWWSASLLITFLIKAAAPTDAITAMYQGQMSGWIGRQAPACRQPGGRRLVLGK